jgi:small subunit ribosomal protein S17
MKDAKSKKSKVESIADKKIDVTPSAIQRKTLTGTVVSINSKDTVKVSILRFVRHPIYEKALRRTHKLLVHNSGIALHVGDSVSIEACRPISKRKHFTVVEKVNG